MNLHCQYQFSKVFLVTVPMIGQTSSGYDEHSVDIFELIELYHEVMCILPHFRFVLNFEILPNDIVRELLSLKQPGRNQINKNDNTSLNHLFTCSRDNFVEIEIKFFDFEKAANKSSPTNRTCSPKCSNNIREHSFPNCVDISLINNDLIFYLVDLKVCFDFFRFYG